MKKWRNYLIDYMKDQIWFFIYSCVYFIIYGYITISQSGQLPVCLIAQLVEHCTGFAEVMGLNPVQTSAARKYDLSFIHLYNCAFCCHLQLSDHTKLHVFKHTISGETRCLQRVLLKCFQRMPKGLRCLERVPKTFYSLIRLDETFAASTTKTETINHIKSFQE